MELFDKNDEALIREIQDNIPLTINPYDSIAQKLGCSKEEILKRLQDMSQQGILRRIGAILRHRNSGYHFNGMLVCFVPEEKIMTAGGKLSSFTQVSHCYRRKTASDWPYNLYGMIHGKTKEEVEQVVKCFVDEMEITIFEILYSIEELKKTSIMIHLE